MEREMHCPLCKYRWKTKSKLRYVTCPSCLGKVKVRERE